MLAFDEEREQKEIEKERRLTQLYIFMNAKWWQVWKF